MNQSTINAIESLLKADASVTEEQTANILRCCKQSKNPPPPYQCQGGNDDSFVLSTYAQIFGEARAFAADQLLFEKSEV